MCPFSTPKLSFITFKIGVIAFVVQEAAEKMLCVAKSYSRWFAPNTIFGISFPGAVNNTLETPFAFKCLPRVSFVVNTPVLSINKALSIP